MKIILEKPNPYWKLNYQKEAELIQEQFLKNKQHPVRIEHIGSTAIEGIAAKPTIDIMIGVSEGIDLDATIRILKQSGYIYVSKYNAALPERRFFIKIKNRGLLPKEQQIEIKVADEVPRRSSFERLFHVHLVHEQSRFWNSHLTFRNHLRSNTADKKLYQELKLHLSRQDWEKESDYAQAKSSFITAILTKLGF